LDKLLKVEEVAAILSIAPATVRQMLWRKELTRVKINRATRIRESEVEALIRLGTGKPAMHFPKKKISAVK